jgi:hypothetical protein
VRGLAYFDVSSITGLETLLLDLPQQLQQLSNDSEAETISQARGTKVACTLQGSADDLRVQVRSFHSSALVSNVKATWHNVY